MERLLHTPEGVRDIYGLEFAKKEAVMNNIAKTFHLYGFRNIQTPTFEYADTFDPRHGCISYREMYQFFDKEGERLVLRPDITPSIARTVAMLFNEEDMPLRLSYCGNVFTNSSSLQLRLKEATQMGGELVGDVTSDADGEMIALLIESLLASGLTEFQVEIGNVNVFSGLLEEANLSDEEIDLVRKAVMQKNFFGIEDLLQKKDLPERLKKSIMTLPQVFGDISKVKQAKETISNETSLSGLAYLEKIYNRLAFYGYEKYITFDLGMLGRYRYYTGVIFKAYTYGTGEAVALGGRYDTLIAQYGREAASVGFAINVDILMTAIRRQNIPVETDYPVMALLYDRSRKEEAIRMVQTMRKKGVAVSLLKQYFEKSVEDYISYSKRSGFSTMLYLKKESTEIVKYNVEDGSSVVVSNYLEVL